MKLKSLKELKLFRENPTFEIRKHPTGTLIRKPSGKLVFEHLNLFYKDPDPVYKREIFESGGEFNSDEVNLKASEKLAKKNALRKAIKKTP
jgi:hypothetical protein